MSYYVGSLLPRENALPKVNTGQSYSFYKTKTGTGGYKKSFKIGLGKQRDGSQSKNFRMEAS